jgi:hypothetical protein
MLLIAVPSKQRDGMIERSFFFFFCHKPGIARLQRENKIQPETIDGNQKGPDKDH